MIKGFSVKNILIGSLAGALVATNFHEVGLSAAEISLWASVVGTAVWIVVEELEISYGRHSPRLRKKSDLNVDSDKCNL